MEVRHLGNGFGAKNTLMPYISKSSICISSMLSYTALGRLKTKQIKASPPPPPTQDFIDSPGKYMSVYHNNYAQ